VGEVGSRTGFSSARYFSMSFRRLTGMSPMTFRKQVAIPGCE